MKTIKGLFIVAAILIANFSFAQNTETRKVGAFSKLSVEGRINAVLEKGNEESVRIVTENFDLKEVATEIKDGSLKIYLPKDKENGARGVIKDIFKNGVEVRTRITVYVTYKSLEKIGRSGSGNLTSDSELNVASFNNSGSGNIKVANIKNPNVTISTSGSGDVVANSIATDNLQLSVSGSGSIKVAGGSAQKMSSSVAGSGKIDASALKSNDCSVNIAGSGHANVYASSTIAGSISGSGHINYSGDAKVTKNAVAGSGKMRKQG